MLHLNDRLFYSCFLNNTRPAMSKTSLDFVFFCGVNHNLKTRRFFSPLHFSEPWETKGRGLPCDWWISIRFVCFCVSWFVALILKSIVSFTLALSFFFNFFILKRGKFRFQRWKCSYRASKSGGNTDTEGWKRTGTFPPTFTFADKQLANTVDATVTVW